MKSKSQNKTVMLSIADEVKWSDNRDEIVRYADEKLAFSHPSVTAEISRLRKDNRELKHQLFAEQSHIGRLLDLVIIPFWNIRKLKRLLKSETHPKPKPHSQVGEV